MIGPLLGKERELTLMAVLVSFVMLDPVPGVAGDQAARGAQMHAQGVLCTKKQPTRIQLAAQMKVRYCT
jgi:hypothetical protein